MINGWSNFPCPSLFTIAMVFWVLSFWFSFLHCSISSRLLLLTTRFIIFHCFALHPLSVSFYYTFSSNFQLPTMWKCLKQLFVVNQKSVLQIFVCIHNVVIAFVSILPFFRFRSAFSTGRWQNLILISINFNRSARFSDAVLYVVIFSISLSWSAIRLTIKRKAIERVFSHFICLDIGCYIVFVIYIENWARKNPKEKETEYFDDGCYNVSCMAPSTMLTWYVVSLSRHHIAALCSNAHKSYLKHDVILRVVEWLSPKLARHFSEPLLLPSANILEHSFNLIFAHEKEFISFHL